MPVRWEEDEELFRIAVIETGLLHIIIIMDDVGLVFVLRRAAHMIDNTKTFRSFHGPLEINVVKVALTVTLL